MLENRPETSSKEEAVKEGYLKTDGDFLKQVCSNFFGKKVINFDSQICLLVCLFILSTSGCIMFSCGSLQFNLF